MHVRVCRDCGEEYRPEILVCADCGGTLEDRHEDDGPRTLAPTAPEPPAADDDDPPPGFRPVFVTGQAAALVPLAERLREAGIEFRMRQKAGDQRTQAASFSLLVHDEDGGRALREIAPLLAGATEPERLHALETEFEAGAYRRCPACATELAGGALECPECGLGLVQSGETCAACGAPLGPDDTECAQCNRT